MTVPVGPAEAGRDAAVPNEALDLLENYLVNAPTTKFAGTVTLTMEARKAGLSGLGSPSATMP